jgi:hypothetical protein
MTTIGPDAEAKYQASMTKLRQQGVAVVTLLAKTYDAEKHPINRWAAVETLAELRSPAARPHLDRIASEPIPNGAKGVPHSFDQESVNRMTATRGLGYLAVRDDAAARGLGKLAQHEMAAIHGEARRSLALAIRQEKNKQRRAMLIALVPNWEWQAWLPPVEPIPVPTR